MKPIRPRTPSLGRRLLALAACVLATTLAGPSAQAQSLVNGGVVSGSIAPSGDVDTYTFTASVGENFQLQVADIAAGPLHPYMRLFDPSGALLASDQSASVAAIFLTAPASGTYMLEVSDWNGPGTGSYNVYYAKAPGANDGGLLTSGSSVTGTIDLGDLDSFTFDVSAGENFQLQVADVALGSFHPLMRLYDPSGAYVTGDQSQSVAAIFLTAASTGTYTLVISDWNQAGTGDFEIHYTLAPGANEHGALINAGFVSESIDLGDLDSYTFDVTAGENFQLQMADVGVTGFHPLMRLYGPSGAFVAADQSQSVAAIFLTAASTGTYTLVVSDWNQAGTGDYEIHYTLAPGANEHGALINGGFVSESIDLGDLDSYTFDVTAGENVQLQMADIGVTGFHPLMRLYDPSGAFLFADQSQSVAALFFTAPSTGTYTLVVSDWNQAGIGDFNIYFTRRPGVNEGGALINGGSVTGTIDLGDLDSYTFDVSTGENFQLQMADVGVTGFHPLMRLYGPSGEFVAADQSQSVAAIFLTAASTGTYTLVVSDWNQSGTGDYEIHYTLAPGANEHGALTNGGFVSQSIGLGDLDSYAFELTAGEGFQLQMADIDVTGFHPLMRLYDPSGAFVAAAQSQSVAALFLTAASTGTYTLVVSDWNQAGTGNYVVHYTRAPGANEGGKIVHGDALVGTIDLGDLDSFTFTAYTGEDIELSMTDANLTGFHPLMRLYDPSGTFVQAAQGQSVATIVRTAQSTGTYTLVLSDWNLGGTGDYGLSIDRGVEIYCTAGTTAIGCTAQMSAYGDPSASAANGFLVRATGGEGDQVGIFFFGTSGRQAIQWGNGTSFLCVIPPIERTPAANGGGAAGQCNASASFDFNELITLNPQAAPPVGSLVQVQYWFRDPANPSNQTSALSDAMEFTLQP